MINSKPHLVPSNLVGQRFARDTFGDTKIALIGYCPPPQTLKKYSLVPTREQYFIHLAPDSVMQFTHQNRQFLSLFHLYGGPVSASTVEELAYYGFDYILAYGLAGGLGTKNLRMGDTYLVEKALVADGTTPHYTDDQVVWCDEWLKAKIQDVALQSELGQLTSVQAITGDAIYREDDEYIDAAKAQGCDITNCDSSHLYAVSKSNDEGKRIRSVECGVISDVIGDANAPEWDSALSVMLASQDSGGINPLELTGKIVEFYVERLAPFLLGRVGG